jgi:hypothetical protein
MSEEKKIIIDEDWKNQVAAEREALAEDPTPLEDPTSREESLGHAHELPPASLELLLTSLATEAMISLGQMPSFGSQQLEVNLEQARYAIDMLQVLEDKTKGNVTPDEAGALKDLLHQLRLMFVAVQQQAAKSPEAK